MIKTLRVNEKLLPFLTKHKPIKVAYGGRNSGKSIAFGDMLTVKMESERADVFCLREFQDSINDSVHRVFAGSIKRLGLDGWDVQESKVVSPHGNITRYVGAARNPDSIQSAEGYKYSWYEEAHRASEKSLDKLLPTIIRRPGAECWFSANPQSSGDPFSQRFIVPFQEQLDRYGHYEDELHLIVKINWRDNPWYDSAAESLRLNDLRTMPRSKYEWIWEGAFNDHVDNGIIKQEWFEACVDAHVKLGFKPQGIRVVAHDPADLGNDAKTLVDRHGSVVLNAMEMDGGDIFDGCDWATDYALAVNADLFVFDGDGMGAPLRERIAAKFKGKRIDWQMYRGSDGVEDPDSTFQKIDGHRDEKHKTNADIFFNLRVQQYFRLASRMFKTWEAVTKGEYRNPDEMISFSSDIKILSRLQSELCRLPLKDNGNGKMQLKTKGEMAKDGIPSPNIADACKMSIRTGIAGVNKPKREKRYPKISMA